MASENDELITSFIEEANEVLADVENDFLSIEDSGADVDQELVNKVFRGIHSMKGSAGFLGLKSIGSLAHESENVLNLIRNHELVPTHQIIDALLRSADALRAMVNDIHNSNDVDVSEYINGLKAAVKGETTPEVQEALDCDVDISLPNGSLAFVLVNAMDLILRQREGNHIYVLEIDFIKDVQAKNRTPLQFLKKTYEYGEVIDSYISTAGITDLTAELPDSLCFFMLYASKSSVEDLAKALELDSNCIHHIATPEQTAWDKQDANQTSETPAPSVPEKQQDQTASTNQPAKQPEQKQKKQTVHMPVTQPQSSLRVNVKVLDVLMNLAGELVLGRNQLLQEAISGDFRGINSVAARIDQVTSELQEAIMQTRMQPIGTIFNKFPRIVRDLSSNLGKQCELTIEGKDVELDKTIIEAIGDPLTHLIRNSVDHGIENPDVRSANGKDPCGKIILKAYHQAGKVNIAIIDDGAGINAEKIKAKAVEKGVLTTEQAQEMSERDAVRLIFHPGFSTAEVVTSVSGRGVGMDVVKTNIEKLGGTIDIDTEVGAGTSITIKLPLTLAIIPSLIIRSGQNKFAISQVNICELVRIKASEVSKKIEKVKDAELLRLRGDLLPLVRLSQVLEKPSKYRDINSGELLDNRRVTIADRRRETQEDLQADPPQPEDKRSGEQRRRDTLAGALNIVVVEANQVKYGLIVDELYDSKEIVVKPLDHHIKNIGCLAGATILGDGKIALILDIAGIASYMQLSSGTYEDIQEARQQTTDTDGETQSVLIFSNDPNELFAIPTTSIARIERIKTAQIDTVGEQQILQYRGASLPLICLEDYIQTTPRPQLDTLHVVVFKVREQEIGLIAPTLMDIREISSHIDTTIFAEEGVAGSVILDNKSVRMLDIFNLAQRAQPQWFDSSEQQVSNEDRQITILLAEDSNFFRQQMASFMESSGYKIIACEDGQIAWETLQKEDVKVDLVVTDIEMPNMDGLTLAEMIKKDSRFAHLPIIAVTSLAGDDDIARGQKVGIDDYQIKLDRDKLLEAIQTFVRQAAHA